MCVYIYIGLPRWLSDKEPTSSEMRAGFLGWEDHLEMAIHSSILAWEIPRTEEADGLQSMGSQRVGHDLVTTPPPPRKSVSPTHQQKIKELLSMTEGRRRRGPGTKECK